MRIKENNEESFSWNYLRVKRIVDSVYVWYLHIIAVQILRFAQCSLTSTMGKGWDLTIFFIEFLIRRLTVT